MGNPHQGSQRKYELCPNYREADCTEEYLTTFMGICSENSTPDEQRVTILLSKLTGKAMQVFNNMDVNEGMLFLKGLCLKDFRGILLLTS